MFPKLENKKQRVKGFSNNGVKWEGQKNFDQDYISIEIVDVAKKTGEGDRDFVITKEVVVTKQPIAEVVAVDADSVGVYNIMKQFDKTGDVSLIPADKGQPFVDMVGAPENLMEVKALGQRAEEEFKNLPQDLVGGLDMVNFVNSMSQEKFDAFVKAMSDRSAKKVEEKKDE